MKFSIHDQDGQSLYTSGDILPRTPLQSKEENQNQVQDQHQDQVQENVMVEVEEVTAAIETAAVEIPSIARVNDVLIEIRSGVV